MTTKLIYSLDTVNSIIFNGFNYELSDETIAIISELAKQVGAPDYIKTPNFQNKPVTIIAKSNEKDNFSFKKNKIKSFGKTKATEINENEWNALKTFQNTTKNEFDKQVDIIRSHLNKLTDKNYQETFHNICKVINDLLEINETDENMLHIASIIFDIASTNRFYSKIYSNLYRELSDKYIMMKTVFETNFSSFIDLFINIDYVDASVDYNQFIKNNEISEKRKSLASFYLNLMDTNLVSKDQIVIIIANLLTQVYSLISIENKKKEVEEITEIIAILYKKDMIEPILLDKHLIQGKTILEIIEFIAKSKIKDYKSLTSKSLFKFMDMIEM